MKVCTWPELYVICYWSRTNLDSQPAAVAILNGPLENRRHVAYFHADSVTGAELKFAATNGQVANLQTGHIQGMTSLWKTVEGFNSALSYVCMCASSYLSRPYVIFPTKAMDFSPLMLGYRAC